MEITWFVKLCILTVISAGYATAYSCQEPVIRLPGGLYYRYTRIHPRYDFVHIYSAHCLQGYQLVGRQTDYCRTDFGDFNYGSSACEDVNECATPEELEELCTDENAECINTVGSYQCRCKAGFVEEPESCTCVPAVQCPRLVPPPGGEIEMHGTTALIRCTDDFIMDGVTGNLARMTCDLLTGEWSGDMPRCVLAPTSCGDPGTPEHGEKIASCHYRGCVATFICDDEYTRVGPTQRVCTEYQQWSGYQPFCEAPQTLACKAKEFRENVVDRYTVHSAGTEEYGDILEGRLNLNQPVGIDLVFMMDRSSSIAEEHFQTGIGFAGFILHELGVSNVTGATKVATVSFGDEAKLEFNLDDPDIDGDEDAIIRKLNAIKPDGGGTNTAAALVLINTDVNPKLRPGAKHVIFMMTDGRSTIGDNPVNMARNLRTGRHQYEIFAIGVGNNVDREQLRLIASEPYQEHVFLLDSFQELKDLWDIVAEQRTNYELCGVSGNVEAARVDDAGDMSFLGGAVLSNKGAFPWLAVLRHNEDYTMSRMCAGAIICGEWIVTTASCLEVIDPESGNVTLYEPQDVSIVGGQHDMFTANGEEQNNQAREFYRHPGYVSGQHLINNIALVRTATTFRFNKWVRAACVPTNESYFVAHYTTRRTGEQLQQAGWGSLEFSMNVQNPSWYNNASSVRQAKIPIVDRHLCAQSVRGILNDDVFCAGFAYQPGLMCQGDLGGPVLGRSADHFYVLGVGQRPTTCAQVNRYRVYTDVLGYIDWIHNVTGNCNVGLQ